MEKDVTAIISSCKFGTIKIMEANKLINEAFAKKDRIDSVIIGEHIKDCNIKKLVDDGDAHAKNPWSVTDMRRIQFGDENGNELTYSEMIDKGHAETWLEFPCFGTGCKCVKRVRMASITDL